MKLLQFANANGFEPFIGGNVKVINSVSGLSLSGEPISHITATEGMVDGRAHDLLIMNVPAITVFDAAGKIMEQIAVDYYFTLYLQPGQDFIPGRILEFAVNIPSWGDGVCKLEYQQQ